MNAFRGQIKTEQPDLTFGELTKKLTEMWKALDDGERGVYEELAVKDKARYQSEMEEKGLAKKLTEAEANKPKPNQRAFIMFSYVERAKIKLVDDTLPNPKMLQKLAIIWQGKTVEEKKVWQDAAKVDKARYEKEMAAYNAGIEDAKEKMLIAGTKRKASAGKLDAAVVDGEANVEGETTTGSPGGEASKKAKTTEESGAESAENKEADGVDSAKKTPEKTPEKTQE